MARLRHVSKAINKLREADSALTTADLDKLASVDATAAELNILDGVTSTAAELNILDGVTADKDELNIMDGVTATTAELNIMDGVTATFTELNLNTTQTATAAEVNILDGVTATTAEVETLAGGTAVTKVAETVGYAAFTDNLDATGQFDLTFGTIPIGATFIRAAVTAVTGFTGDTTAVMTIGDGTDVDRYNAGTIDVFTTAANGIDAGVPSGALYHDAAATVRLTITGGADFTSIAAGSVTVELYYIE
jgi:hypothetical protein